MERAAYLLILLCAAHLTAAAPASALPPLLPRDGGSSAASAAQARPLRLKGKTVQKYVTKLYPTKLNGKLVGDKGASGKFVIKAVRFSTATYYIVYIVKVFNIKSGGYPSVGTGSSCAATELGAFPFPFKNITSAKSGRRKRYSFAFSGAQGPMMLEEAFGGIVVVLVDGLFVRVGYTGNFQALCGKLKKTVSLSH
ncbi:unnamed protein product [Closterium sp. NIES-53]